MTNHNHTHTPPHHILLTIYHAPPHPPSRLPSPIPRISLDDSDIGVVQRAHDGQVDAGEIQVGEGVVREGHHACMMY
ncbi:hypothetical protein EON63_13950 [archaeon]|nr:MAG: hypothetical protein EON63_13950 [archaeon]